MEYFTFSLNQKFWVFLNRLGFILFLTTLPNLSAFGASNWTLVATSGQLTEGEIRRVQEKVSVIRSGEDVKDLLRTIGKLYIISSATVELLENGTYKVSVGLGRRISRIRLVSKTSVLKNEIQQTFLPFLFMADSPELQDKLKSRVSEMLKQKGYPKSTVSIEAVPVNDREVNYQLNVSMGEPCVIESLNLSFKLPREFDIDISRTDICDRDLIEEKARLLVDELQAAGYKRAEMESVKYLFNSSRNALRVLIEGKLGVKVRYELKDVTSRFFLEDLFDDQEISDLDPSFTSPDSFMAEVASRYRKKGYDDVTIKLVSEPLPNVDEQVYVFGVDPGNLYYLDKVSITGAKGIPEKEIKKMIIQKPFWARQSVFDRTAFIENLSAVRNAYLSEGFWNVQISEPIFSKNSDTKSVSMTLEINEGTKSILGSAHVSGAVFFPEADLLEEFELEVGDPINRKNIVDFERAVRRKYFEQGFLYVSTALNYEESEPNIKNESQVKVTVSIEEGKRVRVGDIEISGLVETKKQVVEREILFETGDWYLPEIVDQTRRNLLTIGVFQTVSIEAMHPENLRDEPDIVDIVVDVRERPPGMVAFGPGWSINDGNRFTIESSYSNIAGLGRQVFAKGMISEDAGQDAIGSSTLLGRSVTFGFLEPYLFKTPVNATLSIFHSSRAFETWNTSQGSEVSFSHKLRKYFLGATISAFYAFKSTKEEGSSEQEAGYLELLGGDLKISRVGIRWQMDERDDAGWPTTGYYLSLELSAARRKIAGDVDYDQWGFTYNRYYPIPSSKFVIAGSFGLSSFSNVKRSGEHPNVLPQSETLHLGGADSVRGFADRSLGPKVEFQNNVAEGESIPTTESTRLGGSQSSLFKLEIRYLTEYLLGISGFLDFGSLFFSPEEVADFNRMEEIEAADDGRERSIIRENAYFDWEEFLTDPEKVWKRSYSSTGVGLSYLTPLGTLNFAYGIPWKDCSLEGECSAKDPARISWLLSGRFHLNISTTF